MLTFTGKRVAFLAVVAVVALAARAGGTRFEVRGGAAGAPVDLLENGSIVLRLRRAEKVSLAAEHSKDPRVLYPFRDGAYVGTLHVQQDLRDARGAVISPADYEAQYCIQPPLKEHVDATEYRDFLLLSRGEPIAGEHPLVLELVPARGAVGDPPRLRDDGFILEFDLGSHRLAVTLSV